MACIRKRFAFCFEMSHFSSKERIRLNSTINGAPSPPHRLSLLTFAVQVTAHSVGMAVLLLIENKEFIG